MIIEIHRACARIPSRFRLSLDITAGVLTEARVIPFKSEPIDNPDWPSWEPGISLVRAALRVDKKRAKFTDTILATVSLHCLGRWMERARDTAEPVLLRDLSTLGSEVELPVTQKDFVMPTQGGNRAGSSSPSATMLRTNQAL